MEADWEFEIAADAPVIDAGWPGLVDLREEPHRAAELPETERIAALAGVLERLNEAASPVWTSKCDVWEPNEFDPDELDAVLDSPVAIACYIDLLPREIDTWATLDDIADWCRRLTKAVRTQSLKGCRIDLVIRRAVTGKGQVELGITAYFVACGSHRANAAEQASRALIAFADAVAG